MRNVEPEDAILASRRQCVEAMLKASHQLANRYLLLEQLCKHSGRAPSYVGHQCDAMVLGSLIKGLYKIGIWAGSRTDITIYSSVEDFSEQLKDIVCYNLPDSDNSYDRISHSGYKFQPAIGGDISRLVENRGSGVLDSHIEHLKGQQRK